MIIDIHTHVPPEAQWPLFLGECDRNGVGLAVASSLGSWAHWPDAEDVRRANEEAARFADMSAGRVLWLAYLNPHLPDGQAELDRCLAAGARGVKLWVCLKDRETGRLDRVEGVLHEADRRGLPVLLHTFDRTEGNLPGEIHMGEFAGLARSFPRVRMIAAHAGGNWRQALGLLPDLANTFVDVSGGFPEAGMVEALVRDLGAERVLYGSDGLGRSMPSQLAKVLHADIGDETREAILGRNSARLLGMDAGAVPVPAAASGAESSVEGLAVDEDHFCFCGGAGLEAVRPLDAATLDAALGAQGVSRAFAADAGGIRSRELLTANRAFAAMARGCRRIRPLAALLPTAPNALAVLAEAAGAFEGGILYPALHGWRLDDVALGAFWEACVEHRFPLWINVALGDARFRHPGEAVREVSNDELTAFSQQRSRTPCVVQGASTAQILACLEADPADASLRFEISRLTDTTTALADMISRFGTGRLVMGSEFPLRDLRTVRFTAGRLIGGAQPSRG